MLSLSDCFRTPIPTRACPSFVVETLLKHYLCVLVFMRPSHLFPPPIMFFFCFVHFHFSALACAAFS